MSLIFFEEISGFSHSIVVLYFFALITDEGSLTSLLDVLWNSAFKWVYLSFSPLPSTSLLFTFIYKASSDNHFLHCLLKIQSFIERESTVLESRKLRLIRYATREVTPCISSSDKRELDLHAL